MAINANRYFTKWGMKFLVQNMPSNAKERMGGYKYSLYVIDKKGFFRLVHDKITLNVPHFKTIKDAQRWVWFCSGEGDFVETDTW